MGAIHPALPRLHLCPRELPWETAREHGLRTQETPQRRPHRSLPRSRDLSGYCFSLKCDFDNSLTFLAERVKANPAMFLNGGSSFTPGGGVAERFIASDSLLMGPAGLREFESHPLLFFDFDGRSATEKGNKPWNPAPSLEYRVVLPAQPPFRYPRRTWLLRSRRCCSRRLRPQSVRLRASTRSSRNICSYVSGHPSEISLSIRTGLTRILRRLDLPPSRLFSRQDSRGGSRAFYR